MKKQYLFIALALCLVLIPLVNAEDLVYKQGQIIDLKIPCYNNDTYCSASALCNITINYPNGTNVINNQVMTYNPSYFNYTLNDSSIIGIYATSIVCLDNGFNGYKSFAFYITPDGAPISQAKADTFTTLSIIFLVLSLLLITAGFLSKKMPILSLGILLGLTFLLFTLQTLMINPYVKADVSMYKSIITFYQVYIWIYYGSFALIVIFLIFQAVQWQNYNKKEKMRKWGLLMEDEQ